MIQDFVSNLNKALDLNLYIGFLDARDNEGHWSKQYMVINEVNNNIIGKEIGRVEIFNDSDVEDVLCDWLIENNVVDLSSKNLKEILKSIGKTREAEEKLFVDMHTSRNTYTIYSADGKPHEVPNGVPSSCAQSYYNKGQLVCGCVNPSCPWNSSYDANNNYSIQKILSPTISIPLGIEVTA